MVDLYGLMVASINYCEVHILWGIDVYVLCVGLVEFKYAFWSYHLLGSTVNFHNKHNFLLSLSHATPNGQ